MALDVISTIMLCPVALVGILAIICGKLSKGEFAMAFALICYAVLGTISIWNESIAISIIGTVAAGLSILTFATFALSFYCKDNAVMFIALLISGASILNIIAIWS